MHAAEKQSLTICICSGVQSGYMALSTRKSPKPVVGWGTQVALAHLPLAFQRSSRGTHTCFLFVSGFCFYSSSVVPGFHEWPYESLLTWWYDPNHTWLHDQQHFIQYTGVQQWPPSRTLHSNQCSAQWLSDSSAFSQVLRSFFLHSSSSQLPYLTSL